MNTKVLILYYSTWGHVEQMAQAVAEGVREVQGTEAVIKRVPELMPEEVAKGAGAKLDQAAPIATPAELADYDAIIIGTPTRYGRMAAQMANFLDQTGQLWFQDKLVGKIGSVFASTASQHGGQETTLISTIVNLMHLGMTIVGLPYSEKRQLTLDEVAGGSPTAPPPWPPATAAASPPRSNWPWPDPRVATWQRRPRRRNWARHR